MNKDNKQQLKDQSGLALALLVLFIIITAICPVKRIFAANAHRPASTKQVKSPASAQHKNIIKTDDFATSLCGTNFVQFKKSITSSTVSRTAQPDLYLLSFTVLFLVFAFRGLSTGRHSHALLPAYIPTGISTPLFILNKRLLI